MRCLTPETNQFFVDETKMAFIADPRQVGKKRWPSISYLKSGWRRFISWVSARAEMTGRTAKPTRDGWILECACLPQAGIAEFEVPCN